MTKEILSQYVLGDICCIYIIDKESNNVGFTVIPQELRENFTLDGKWKVESLVQVKKTEDAAPDGFSNGLTMRNSQTARELVFHKQYKDENGRIVTVVKSDRLEAKHYVAAH